ncbi:MAG: aminotransferase class IV [Roseovarius sp.]|nr:aminotransferase class IV [Roseovarius sp.]MCY4207629.1 aminotransferase class IV [Roseovarius sp.]
MTEDYSKGAAWIKGEIVPVSKAAIGVTDWGLTHSDIAYDVVPVWQGAFFRLPDYIARFLESVESCRMSIEQSPDQIQLKLHDMVAKSGLRDAYVAMVASRGTPIIPGSRDPRDCANHFYAWCVPYIHVIKPKIAEAGARIWISSKIRRIPHDSVNPRAKNYHWGDFTQGLFEARDRNFDTVILEDHHGNVTEGPGFNVFALKNGTIVTPLEGVLHGVTRRTVLEMAREQGLETLEGKLSVEELFEADEVFLSSSGGGVIPVSRICDRHFSNDAAGPVAMKLRKTYFKLLEDPCYRNEIDYGTFN